MSNVTTTISSMAETYGLFNTTIRSFDEYVAKYLFAIRKPLLETIFFFITHFADLLVVMLIVLLVALLLKTRGYHQDIIPLVTVVVGAALSSETLKLFFGRARPETAVYFEPTFSFPSTHASVALALYGFLAFLLIKRFSHKKLALILATLSITVAFLVGFSRLYLGVHFASDVIGGFLIALFWIIVAIRLDKALPNIFAKKV